MYQRFLLEVYMLIVCVVVVGFLNFFIYFFKNTCLLHYVQYLTWTGLQVRCALL